MSDELARTCAQSTRTAPPLARARPLANSDAFRRAFGSPTTRRSAPARDRIEDLVTGGSA